MGCGREGGRSDIGGSSPGSTTASYQNHHYSIFYVIVHSGCKMICRQLWFNFLLVSIFIPIGTYLYLFNLYLFIPNLFLLVSIYTISISMSHKFYYQIYELHVTNSTIKSMNYTSQILLSNLWTSCQKFYYQIYEPHVTNSTIKSRSQIYESQILLPYMLWNVHPERY